MTDEQSFEAVVDLKGLLDVLHRNVDAESNAIIGIYSTESKKRPPTALEPKGTSIENLKTMSALWKHKRYDIQDVLHKIG